MPPKNKMPAEVIENFRSWIAMGAPDPRVKEAATVRSAIDLEAGQSILVVPQAPVFRPSPAETGRLARGTVDRFVLTAMEQKGLHPVADAAPEALVRRLHFDLIGLPPSPEEVQAFLRAWKVDPERALAVKTDALLRQPPLRGTLGPSLARRAARFAESTGKELNLLYPHAWRYRRFT